MMGNIGPIANFYVTHEVVLVMDGNFALVCRLREFHVGQWFFKEFFIFVSIIFIFSRPPPLLLWRNRQS